MRLRRGGQWIGALVVIGSAFVAAVPSSAQIYEAARQSIGFGPDPIARSPRLAGMGRLTVVGDDDHNRLTLWDFARNPVGIGEDDSVSTFELRPGTSAASGVRDIFSITPHPELQNLAAREYGTGFEGWRRAAGVAYGAIGSISALRVDQPTAYNISGVTEGADERSHYALPEILAVLNGPMPYVQSGRLRYALSLLIAEEEGDAEFRDVVFNAAGVYIDRDGTLMPPPSFFVPDAYRISTTGFGASVSYHIGKGLTAALTGDLIYPELESHNNGDRYSSEFREQMVGNRPFPSGQATLVGHFGHLEYGLDGKIWDAKAEQRWSFTTSAGVGQDALAGRGKYAEHEQRGSTAKARLRWSQGALELGGALSSAYSENTITPPGIDDPTSFNRFLVDVYYRPNADTLALPDSVSNRRSENRTWQATGGAALRLGRKRGLLGVEYHASQSELDQNPGGLGPRQTHWDVRAGLEYRCTSVLLGRAGYIYSSDDLDDLTKSNEYLGNTMTLGLGLQPTGSIWSLDAGWAMEWWQADYGDPGEPRGSRQRLATQIRWTF